MNTFLRLLVLAFAFLHHTNANSDENLHEKFGPPTYTHSLYMPYVHSQYENDHWSFGGSTIVRVYDSVRLTSNLKSQQGFAWSKTPLSAGAWVVDFEFRIHGGEGHVYGDGFAFWFVDSTYEKGDVFGYKDMFKGLGVFFDTFANGVHTYSFPYISAMVGDGKTHYDLVGDNAKSMVGHGCEANIRESEDNIRARITYYKNHILQLEFTDSSNKAWQTCFTLNNIVLPDKGYIGFSAKTGDAFENHDLIRVTTYSHIPTTEYKGTDATDGNLGAQGFAAPLSSSHGFFSWLMWSLLKVGAVGVVVAGAYFAYGKYNKKLSSKHF